MPRGANTSVPPLLTGRSGRRITLRTAVLVSCLTLLMVACGSPDQGQGNSALTSPSIATPSPPAADQIVGAWKPLPACRVENAFEVKRSLEFLEDGSAILDGVAVTWGRIDTSRVRLSFPLGAIAVNVSPDTHQGSLSLQYEGSSCQFWKPEQFGYKFSDLKSKLTSGVWRASSPCSDFAENVSFKMEGGLIVNGKPDNDEEWALGEDNGSIDIIAIPRSNIGLTSWTLNVYRLLNEGTLEISRPIAGIGPCTFTNR